MPFTLKGHNFVSKIVEIRQLRESESRGRRLPGLRPRERHTGTTCRHVFVCVCDVCRDVKHPLYFFHTVVKRSLVEKLPSYGALTQPHLTTSLTPRITHHSHHISPNHSHPTHITHIHGTSHHISITSHTCHHITHISPHISITHITHITHISHISHLTSHVTSHHITHISYHESHISPHHTSHLTSHHNPHLTTSHITA